MGAMDPLILACELERQDVDVAHRLGTVTAVLAEVDELRDRVERVREGLAAIPGEIEHAERDELEARVREAQARQELEEAGRAFDGVQALRRANEEARLQAERALERATVAATDASASAKRARERLEAIVRDEAALQAQAEGLAVEAIAAARELAAVPRLSQSGRSRPGTSLAAIAEWGARTHAALFLVRGSLEAERERLVLEANGLAAVTLGDHSGGSSVALVRRRLEAALRTS